MGQSLTNQDIARAIQSKIGSCEKIITQINNKILNAQKGLDTRRLRMRKDVLDLEIEAASEKLEKLLDGSLVSHFQAR